MIDLRHGDCLEILPTLPDNSVDAVVTDPPYFRVKNEAWDRQWNSKSGFLAWLDSILAEFHRILKPNGSLYIFASPQMAARVEVLVGERFNVLNSIVWAKTDGTPNNGGLWSRANKESLRQFFTQTERIIFAEHIGADNIAKGEAGYEAKCDKLKGFVFEPLRAYLKGEVIRAGMTTRQVAEAYQIKTGSRTVTGMAGHWLEQVQWVLPTEENYIWLQELLNRNGGEYLRREYEDLRREYEDLRREYEDLRRPFAVTKDVPYTDVWTFPTVQAYKGKHVCEKPLPLLKHIINTSTKPGAVVLDCFMGSGSTGDAAVSLGRGFIGIEKDEHWYKQSSGRIEAAAHKVRNVSFADFHAKPQQAQNTIAEARIKKAKTIQQALF